MDADVVIRPEARLDFEQVHDWYEGRQAGKGEDFLTRVDDRVAGIRRRPGLHPIVFGKYRRALVDRFPHTLIHEHREEPVTIHGVFPTLRDERSWRRRLP